MRRRYWWTANDTLAIRQTLATGEKGRIVHSCHRPDPLAAAPPIDLLREAHVDWRVLCIQSA